MLTHAGLRVRVHPGEGAVRVSACQQGFGKALAIADAARSGPAYLRGRRPCDGHGARSHAAYRIVRSAGARKRHAREADRLVRARARVADGGDGSGRIHTHIVARQRALKRPALPGQRHVGRAVVGKACGRLRKDRDLPRLYGHACAQRTILQLVVACRRAREAHFDGDRLVRTGMGIRHDGADEVQLHIVAVEGRVALDPARRAFHAGGAVVFAALRACGRVQRKGYYLQGNISVDVAGIVALERNVRGIIAHIAQRLAVIHCDVVIRLRQGRSFDLDREVIRAVLRALVGQTADIVRIDRKRIHRQRQGVGEQAVVVRKVAGQLHLQPVRARIEDGERIAVGPRQLHVAAADRYVLTRALAFEGQMRLHVVIAQVEGFRIVGRRPVQAGDEHGSAAAGLFKI